MMNTCQHALTRMCMCCVCANILHVLCECVLVYMCVGMPMFFMWCVLCYQHKRKKPRCKRLSARLSVIHRGAMVLHSTQRPPLCRLPCTPARLVTTACSESSLEPHPSSQQQDESFASPTRVRPHRQGKVEPFLHYGLALKAIVFDSAWKTENGANDA